MSDLEVGSTQPNVASSDVLDKDLNTVSYESHQKLLAQFKKNQEKLAAIQSKHDAQEIEKKKLEGRKDEVISDLEKRLLNEQSKSLGIVKSVSNKTLKAEITKAALEKGISSDKISKFLKLSEDSFKESDIQIDDEFNIVNKNVFDEIMDKEVKENSEWFTGSAVKVDDLVPDSKAPVMPEGDLSSKSVDELAEML